MQTIEIPIDKGVAILGKRGSGKTEVLKFLVRTWAERGYKVIVLDVIGNLKLLKKEFPKQVEYVRINPKDMERVEGIFKTLLDKGNGMEDKGKKYPLMVVLDEADRYNYGMIRKTYLSDYINEGRNFGMGYTAITRRTADIHKDFVTQADYVFIFRTRGNKEKLSIQDWCGLEDEDADDTQHLELHHFKLVGGDNNEVLIPDGMLVLNETRHSDSDKKE